MHATTVYAAAAMALAGPATAHFFITTPAPVPGSAVKPPLDASGSDFPCHGADLSAGTSTPMAAGSQQPLKFDLGGGANTAVHGGGSCQIALTYETDKAKQKDPASWKVIHSFVGGCPTDAKGNLDVAQACPDKSPSCVNQNLTFQIPQEVQSGNAVLAWTWFNNIGNREMYMNCARVSISGGTGQMSSLPALAVANLAGVNKCTTTEQFNTGFVNPGKYVTTDPNLNYPIKPMQNCGAAASSGSASTGSASTGSASTGSASTGSSGSSGTSGSSNPGGIFAPGASSSPASSPVAAAPAVPKAATTLATVAAPAATPNSGSSAAPASNPAAGSGACTLGQVACSASGFYCIDSTTFGMCAWGCALPQKLAAGTACSSGAVVHAVAGTKKAKRGVHGHARVHRASA